MFGWYAYHVLHLGSSVVCLDPALAAERAVAVHRLFSLRVVTLVRCGFT